jgi:type IV secretory pathway VirB10-like protein
VTGEDAGCLIRNSGGQTTRHAAKLRSMKYAPAPSSVLAALLLAGLSLVNTSAQAGAQWKWRDANGAIQYSDRSPPPGTPESAILSKPLGARNHAPKPSDAASNPSSPALAAQPAGARSSDPELEARRKKAEDEKVAKQKAEEEKDAKQRADNCQRARNYQRTLQDGIRIVRSNAKGEREVMDDKGRAEEMQRTQEAIQANCK